MRFKKKEKKVRNGYLAAFGLLVISYLLVYYITQQIERREKLINHTTQIITKLDILLSCIKDSETGLRGYIITNDTDFLEPYQTSINCISSSLNIIQNLIVKDAVQKQNMDSLQRKIVLHGIILNSIIKDTKDHLPIDKQSMYKRVLYGKEIMDDIRTIVLNMQVHENRLLTVRTSELARVANSLKMIHFTTFIVALFIAIYSMILFNSENRAKKLYRSQLEEGIEKLRIANNDLINLKSIEKFAASGRISRAIAHEVRNPLTNISLAAEQIKDAVPDHGEVSLLLAIITRNATRINDLIVELLNSTKFSQLELIKLSLNSVSDQALELAKDRLELHNTTIIRNYSPDPCIVEVDPDKMAMAILNLIINAIEAMEVDKGILEVKTEQQNGKCLLWVKDNGIGVNEEALSRIFEPYFTQKKNGNGLGLTLSQNIILNHKGSISVESKPGSGTSFLITLNNSHNGNLS